MKHVNGSPPKLHFGRLTEATYSRRVLRANIPAGVALAEVLKPTYLTHHARDIRGGDIVEAACEDGSWIAWLWVSYVSPTEVVMRELWNKEFVVDDAVKSASHEIKWRGPTAKWSVMETSTGEVVKDRFPSEASASVHLKSHLQGLHR